MILGNGVEVTVEVPLPPTVRVAPPSGSSVVVVPVVGPPGPQGPPGASTSEGQLGATVTTAVAVSGHRVVTVDENGAVRYADNTIASDVHAPLWLTTGAAGSGGEVVVVMVGVVEEPTWSWTPGPVYLGTDGQLTQTPPVAPAVFLAQVGQATAPTVVYVDRQPSILLT